MASRLACYDIGTGSLDTRDQCRRIPTTALLHLARVFMYKINLASLHQMCPRKCIQRHATFVDMHVQRLHREMSPKINTHLTPPALCTQPTHTPTPCFSETKTPHRSPPQAISPRITHIPLPTSPTGRASMPVFHTRPRHDPGPVDLYVVANAGQLVGRATALRVRGHRRTLVAPLQIQRQHAGRAHAHTSCLPLSASQAARRPSCAWSSMSRRRIRG